MNFIKVKDLKHKTINDMFEAICTDILGRTSASVKKDDLKVKGDVSLNDLVSTLEANKISFELKVLYEEKDKKGATGAGKESTAPVKDPLPDTPTTSTLMTDQSKEIKPPEGDDFPEFKT